MSDIRRLHIKAKERASKDDRHWFEANSDRQFRIRKLFHLEIDRPVETYPGIDRLIIVKQIAPGVRLKLLANFVLFDGDGRQLKHTDASDAELADLFDRSCPLHLRKLLRGGGYE